MDRRFSDTALIGEINRTATKNQPRGRQFGAKGARNPGRNRGALLRWAPHSANEGNTTSPVGVRKREKNSDKNWEARVNGEQIGSANSEDTSRWKITARLDTFYRKKNSKDGKNRTNYRFAKKTMIVNSEYQR